MINFTKRLFVLAIVVVATAIAAPLAQAAVVPTGLDFRPSVELDQGSAVVSYRQDSLPRDMLVQWRGTNRVRSIDPWHVGAGMTVNIADFNSGTTTYGTGRVGALADGLTVRNAFSVAPDGTGDLQILLLDESWPLITRQRSGEHVFKRVTRSDGRTVLRASMPIAAVDCAGIRKGVRTVELDPATFMPLQSTNVRGGKLYRRIAIRRMSRASGAMPPFTFAGRHSSRSDGFVARTPVAIAAMGVRYIVMMPAALPDGFSLVRTGFAKKGGVFGPEGSLNGSANVFAAQWRRGLETLDFTTRTGASVLQSSWDDSEPFGYECGTSSKSDATVSGHPAHFSLGEYGGGRLWWRDGATMYTLTAPLPKDELERVAESLAPVSAG